MQLNWAIESIRLFVHPEESKTSSLSSLRSDLRACCHGVTFPSLAGHLEGKEEETDSVCACQSAKGHGYFKTSINIYFLEIAYT